MALCVICPIYVIFQVSYNVIVWTIHELKFYEFGCFLCIIWMYILKNCIIYISCLVPTVQALFSL